MWKNQPLAGRAGWPPELRGRDALAAAGSLIVQNNHNLHAGTVRGPTDRPRRTLHVGYSNIDAANDYSAEPPPPPEVLPTRLRSARTQALAFVAGVPVEYRWAYDSGEIFRKHFAKHDSGYPPPAEAKAPARL
jgi:hypothetical protein